MRTSLFVKRLLFRTISFQQLGLVILLILGGCGICALVCTVSLAAPPENPPTSGTLEFIAPTNNAAFSTLEEIPIVLRGFATNDVFLTAEIFQNETNIATATFCCPNCPCAHPVDGMETILQIAVPWNGGTPPLRTWRGLTNQQPGTYRLTARATGLDGTIVETPPVQFEVLDLTLNILVGTNGAVALVIPQGALLRGSFDLETSEDLNAWIVLGPFQLGNVAAFYFDIPPDGTKGTRFYRSVVHTAP